MKTAIRSVIIAGCLILGLSIQTSAQDPPPSVKKENKNEHKMDHSGEKAEHQDRIPNLTEDQKKKIKDIRVKEKKETGPMKNQLKEKQAHLQTLSEVDSPDMNAINKTIDEMMTLKGSIMKKQAAARQEIRALLTDEQRVVFDQKKGQKNKGKKSSHE